MFNHYEIQKSIFDTNLKNPDKEIISLFCVEFEYYSKQMETIQDVWINNQNTLSIKV